MAGSVAWLAALNYRNRLSRGHIVHAICQVVALTKGGFSCI